MRNDYLLVFIDVRNIDFTQMSTVRKNCARIKNSIQCKSIENFAAISRQGDLFIHRIFGHVNVNPGARAIGQVNASC